MFENLRTGNRALFGDVSDYENGRFRRFCESHKPRRAFFHLPDRAGRAAEIAEINRLNGIDDQKVVIFGFVDNVVEAGFVHEHHVVRIYAEPVATHFNLRPAFFCGGVQNLVFF